MRGFGPVVTSANRRWAKAGFAGMLMIMVIGLTCCRDSSTVWTDVYNFSRGEWAGANTIVFTPDSTSMDRGEASMALLTLRYGADVNVGSFPIIAEIENPAGEADYQCDTLQVKLLEPGMRTGNNSTMGVFEVTDTLMLISPAQPGWRIALYLPEYDTTLTGLFSMTLLLK